ncbi:FKBP-type peptidyl-prolyl cis-trans isomerase [Ereboglobus sp. PH5-10]|uniref:FKBP-type peptidyl-prolyl cis-trans isomerase n=1 Tax=Ereboglobus sp. PH5-10 TaxID=2940629 RepID=UPI002405B301|nr:FKBP-type peptidyl-prolyl cis-trans isomerase [Ereboglobus sp. PH5-10]MDF9828020.1 FKBP-type peptidyl-prolyl cis-trans isomerase [Ereboglobus sp. PH5-10]
MKLKHIITIPALALALAAGLHAQEPATAAPAAAPETAPAPQFTDTQVFEMLGWFVASNMPINELEPTPELVEAMIKGTRQGFEGKPAPYDQEKIQADMQRVIMTRQMAYQAKAKAKADETAAKFFGDLKAKTGVVALPSGVMYEVIKPGEGAYPSASDTVKINYAGTLVDGTEFDSSYKRGQPAEFSLTGVIPGMAEGLQKINKGGKIKIYIPSELGYGERPPPSIPPYAILVFEVELLDIMPPQAPAPAAAVPAAPAAQ